jgi:hypothetical protein
VGGTQVELERANSDGGEKTDIACVDSAWNGLQQFVVKAVVMIFMCGVENEAFM